MSSFARLWFAAALLATMAAHAEVEKDALKHALKLQQSGNYAAAVASYDQLLQANDGGAPAIYANRARCYELILDFANAEKDYTTAISLAPEKAEFYTFRALCRMSAGRSQQALADLDEAIKLDPKHAMSFLVRGLLRDKRGMKNQASEDIRKALELDAKCHIALIRREIGKSAIAIEASAAEFFAELRGDNDPTVQREREEYRRFIEVMGSGYWDLDGRYKFYDSITP